jgi:hypothetical protein
VDCTTLILYQVEKTLFYHDVGTLKHWHYYSGPSHSTRLAMWQRAKRCVSLMPLSTYRSNVSTAHYGFFRAQSLERIEAHCVRQGHTRETQTSDLTTESAARIPPV